MPGILDFLDNVSDDRELSADFVSTVSGTCSRQDLLDFFRTRNYTDVTEAEVVKILSHKENLKRELEVPDNVDY